MEAPSCESQHLDGSLSWRHSQAKIVSSVKAQKKGKTASSTENQPGSGCESAQQGSRSDRLAWNCEPPYAVHEGACGGSPLPGVQPETLDGDLQGDKPRAAPLGDEPLILTEIDNGRKTQLSSRRKAKPLPCTFSCDGGDANLRQRISAHHVGAFESHAEDSWRSMCNEASSVTPQPCSVPFESRGPCKSGVIGHSPSIEIELLQTSSTSPLAVSVSADSEEGLEGSGSDTFLPVSVGGCLHAADSALAAAGVGSSGGAPSLGQRLGTASSQGHNCSWLSRKWSLEEGKEEIRGWVLDTWDAFSGLPLFKDKDWQQLLARNASDALEAVKEVVSTSMDVREIPEEERRLVEWIKYKEVIWDSDPMAVVPLGASVNKAEFLKVAPPCVLNIKEGKEEEAEVFEDIPLQEINEEQLPKPTVDEPWHHRLLQKAQSFSYLSPEKKSVEDGEAAKDASNGGVSFKDGGQACRRLFSDP